MVIKLREVKANHKALAKEISNLSGKDKLIFEIKYLSGQIRSSQYDIDNGFANNSNIVNKHNNLVQQKTAKEAELKKLEEAEALQVPVNSESQ